MLICISIFVHISTTPNRFVCHNGFIFISIKHISPNEKGHQINLIWTVLFTKNCVWVYVNEDWMNLCRTVMYTEALISSPRKEDSFDVEGFFQLLAITSLLSAF